MIRKLADLAAAGIAGGLTLAGALAVVAAVVLTVPMATEYKLAALWILACTLAVAGGLAVVLVVRRRNRARRVTQDALRQACPHHQSQPLFGPLLAFEPREYRAPLVDVVQIGDVTMRIDHDRTVQFPAVPAYEIPQQRRPRPRPEGGTR